MNDSLTLEREVSAAHHAAIGMPVDDTAPAQMFPAVVQRLELDDLNKASEDLGKPDLSGSLERVLIITPTETELPAMQKFGYDKGKFQVQKEMEREEIISIIQTNVCETAKRSFREIWTDLQTHSATINPPRAIAYQQDLPYTIVGDYIVVNENYSDDLISELFQAAGKSKLIEVSAYVTRIIESEGDAEFEDAAKKK